MYTSQALWTMAREKLHVTTVIYSNRVYGVLQREFASLGIGEPGARALDMFEIGRPEIDWVALAKGMGVRAVRATSLEHFAGALRDGFAEAGPSLIQVDL
jgi:acetolactate synthase I/II/III large subunit